MLLAEDVKLAEGAGGRVAPTPVVRASVKLFRHRLLNSVLLSDTDVVETELKFSCEICPDFIKLEPAPMCRSTEKFRASEIPEDVREIPSAAGDFFGDSVDTLGFAARVNGDTVFSVNGDKDI